MKLPFQIARAFLKAEWIRKLDYRLIKELWAFNNDRIAVRYLAARQWCHAIYATFGETLSLTKDRYARNMMLLRRTVSCCRNGP